MSKDKHIWDYIPSYGDYFGPSEIEIEIEKLKCDVKILQDSMENQKSLLRSAYQIAERNGKDTNWDAFKHNVQEELNSCCTAQTYRLLDAEPPEKVEWSVGTDPSKEVFIQSEDFTHDVRLYVNGDFETSSQQLKYAQNIADKLNNK